MARVAAIVVLTGVSLAAVTSAGTATPRLYTVAATRACLERLPGAITGLPPATPPAPPALFVYSIAPDRAPIRAYGKLGIWYGVQKLGEFEGITLSFFKNARDARTSLKSGWTVWGGKPVRNVVVAWDQAAPSRPAQVRKVLGCLRTVAAGELRPKRATPQASLATFAGYWGGHTRGLRITRDGRGLERVNDGCCVHVITVSLQLLRAKGTVTNATATFRVTAVRRGNWNSKRRPRVGQIGQLRLKNGIVTDTLTGVYYCSTPAWGATGACGA